MSTACLLLGTNMGDRLSQLNSARNGLQAAGTILKASGLYRTQPWGIGDQPEFYNQAILLKTALSPEDLLDFLKTSEKQLGREPGIPWGPRLIDMDILFMDDLVIRSEQLSVPHPRVSERMFALVPLAEIAPDWIDPVTGLTIAQLKSQCSDTLQVVRL